MAKQHGILRLEGPLGDLLYYKRDGKYYVRRKTEHKVGTDPRFERTHRKSLDFGTASRASKLLRSALGHTVKPFTDPRWAGRLTARFVQSVTADSRHECGKRQVFAENLAPLKGFQLHKKKSLDIQDLSPKVSIDHQERKITISVDQSLPTGDTQLVACIVSINFQKNTYTHHHSTCSLTEARHSGLQCDLPEPSEPGSAIIVTLGVSSASAGAKHQAMAIIDVSARPIEKAVTPKKLQTSCTTKIKDLKKVVQPSAPFFNPAHCTTKMTHVERSYNVVRPKITTLKKSYNLQDC